LHVNGFKVAALAAVRPPIEAAAAVRPRPVLGDDGR
jgi:hypothetical protein